MMATSEQRRETTMASPVMRRPDDESRPRQMDASHPRQMTVYLSFDNSDRLRDYRLGRERQVEARRQRQQARTYRQLVRALNSALATQTRTTKTSSSAKSKSGRSKIS
jgi:hypothetical protein